MPMPMRAVQASADSHPLPRFGREDPNASPAEYRAPPPADPLPRTATRLEQLVGQVRPFRIASTTQLFVGAAVLRLVEDDRLGLDTSLEGLVSASTLEALRHGGHDPVRITVRHLLSHTAGRYAHQSDDSLAPLDPNFEGLPT